MSVIHRPVSIVLHGRCLALIVLFATTACNKVAEFPDMPGLSPERLALVAEARNDYDTDKERPPLDITDRNFPGTALSEASAPRMWIATMHLKSGHGLPTHRLIAVIRSEGDFAPLGIKTGRNLIWRNSWNNRDSLTWVTKIVPLAPVAPDHVMRRDARRHEYFSGDPIEPRLVRVTVASVSFATCLDDPMCPSGHCGYW